MALLVLLWRLRESFTTYQDALKDVGQTAGYTSLEPKCPAGSTLNSTKTMCKFSDTTKADATPTCANDSLTFVGGVCRSKAQTSGTTSSTTAAAERVDTSRTSGTTTGGTTGTTQGPNSGGGGSRRKQVFGPISMGRGDGGPVPNDSSKSNQYPELMGGDGGRASTRIEGGGIVTPSGEGITLPTSTSLGSDENSKYLPFSRQPGDMEIIPDPYRVSQQFSASNYSFKTEPVPFLTDFSAFQK